MNVGSKHTYEFTNRKEWVQYVSLHMPHIDAQLHKENGTEIWLVTKHGIIGKWCDEKNYGYIEEYRSGARLAEDKNKTKPE